MFFYAQTKCGLPFPEEGLIYDYRFEDDGLLSLCVKDDEEEDNCVNRKVRITFLLYFVNVLFK